MKCPGLRRVVAGTMLSLVVPPFLWLLVVAAAPTGWARERIVAALRRETGHEVRLAAVQLGLLGEVRLRGLELAHPDQPNDPWFQAESVAIDIHAAQLLAGRLAPGKVEAQGVMLRVHRDAEGHFELRRLLRHEPRVHDPSSPRSPDDANHEVIFRLTQGRILVRDEPTGVRLDLTDLAGDGTWRSDRATLHELRGRLNGGPFLLEGELERGPGSPMFEGELRARKVALERGTNILRFITPVLSGAAPGLEGRLDLNLYLRGQGDTRAELERSLAGKGAIQVDPITLEHSQFLSELSRVLTLPEGTRVGSVGGEFELAHGRIGTHDMTVEVGGLPIVLDGWTDYEGRVDYRVRSEGVAQAVSRELRNLLADLPVRVDDVLDIRLLGEPGSYQLTLDGLPIDFDRQGRPWDDKTRLREAARRLRDRLIR